MVVLEINWLAIRIVICIKYNMPIRSELAMKLKSHVARAADHARGRQATEEAVSSMLYICGGLPRAVADAGAKQRKEQED